LLDKSKKQYQRQQYQNNQPEFGEQLIGRLNESFEHFYSSQVLLQGA
jgi:hypothetical protein